jgi:cation diffusion facilitator family transporter
MSREGSLRLALLVCGIDVVLIGMAAWFSTSVTILSDAFKEAADFLAVLAAFLTVRAVRKAPNERFAYGVGKLENLVSMGIGLLMLASAIFILFRSITHLRHPEPTEGTLPGIAIFSVYALIGFGLWLKNTWALRTQHSAIRQSQAQLWFSKALLDALMALALVAALVFRDKPWSLYIDPIAALVGVGFLFHGAWAVMTSSVGDLLDATLDETLQLVIMRSLVEHFDDYDRLHGVRTRRSGPRVYVEVFLEFSPELSMGEVMQRVGRLRQAIGSSMPGADISIVPALQAPAN